MSFTVVQAATMYRVPIIDHGEPRRGVLLGSGSGLMMAIMDQTTARWCVDTDTLRGLVSPYALEQFCVMAHRAEGLALAGWFSYSDPEPLRRALSAAGEGAAVPPVAYAGCIRLGTPGDVDTLEEFIQRASELWRGESTALARTG